MKHDHKITAGIMAITLLVTLPIPCGVMAQTPISTTEPGDIPVSTDTDVVTEELAQATDEVATEPQITPTSTDEESANTEALIDSKISLTKPLIPSGSYPVDISNWKCEDCAFEEGYSGEVELGVGNVSDKSFKFGEYNGLNEDGAFGIVNGNARYRDEDANFMNLSVQDLGLDSRSIEFDAGRQGSYKVFFSYDEISHAISENVLTPYIGNGGANLTLPATWVNASSTSGMTALASSLQNYEVELQRKRMDLGFSINQSSNWKYDIKFRHETREGAKRSAGAFFFNAAQLIEPVDYVTDEIDASVSYVGKHWQATLAYYGSFFSNDNKSLTWEDAFTPLVVGADTGERALPPDNLFHQLILSAGYQITDKTRISGDISVGRMEQDEDFLSPTTNTNLIVPALPRTSLDAQVDTLHGNIRVISAISEKFRFNADFNYFDHDNQTPQSQYTWVSTDDFVNTTRTNQPYSYTRQEFKVGGDYYFTGKTKLAAGVDFDSMERTLQEADKTDETTAWGKLIIRGFKFMDMTFKLSQAERDVSNYQVVPEIDPPQNPILTKYNMADRSRMTAGATINAMPNETLSLGVGIDYAKDDYSESTVGLVDAKEINLNADVSALLTEQSSVHAYVGQERIESNQNGSAGSVPTWFAKNEDRVNSVGIGYKHRLMEDQLDVGVDYVISKSTGKIHITSSASENFPDLEVDLSSIKLYADYRLKDNMSVHAAYWYESYDTRNWALDDVNTDTISNVLSFGEVTPSYDVSVITVSLRYKF